MFDPNGSSSRLLRLLSLTGVLVVAVACENGAKSVAPTSVSSLTAAVSVAYAGQGNGI